MTQFSQGQAPPESQNAIGRQERPVAIPQGAEPQGIAFVEEGVGVEVVAEEVDILVGRLEVAEVHPAGVVEVQHLRLAPRPVVAVGGAGGREPGMDVELPAGVVAQRRVLADPDLGAAGIQAILDPMGAFARQIGHGIDAPERPFLDHVKADIGDGLVR